MIKHDIGDINFLSPYIEMQTYRPSDTPHNYNSSEIFSLSTNERNRPSLLPHVSNTTTLALRRESASFRAL